MPDEEMLGTVETDAGSDTELFNDQPPETVETSPEGEEPAEISPEGDEPPEETDKKEVLPTGVAKLLREIRESNPEHTNIAKELNSAYFANRAYREVFPNLEDAKVLKASFDSIGGQEGLLNLQSTAETLQDLDRMLDDGDPRLIDDILAKSPEGFSKIVPHAIQTLQRVNPQAYEEFIRPELAKAVVGSTAGMYVEAALESLKAGDPDMAARRLAPVLNWMKAMEQEAQKTASPGPDSRAAQFEDRDKGLQQREYEMNQKWVQRDMNTYALSQAEASLRPMLKGVKLSDDALFDLKDGIMREIGKSLMADKTFQRQIDSLVQRGETEKAMELAKPHIDKVKSEAVKAVWQRRYSSFKTPAPTNGQRRTQAPKSGATQQAAIPGVLQVPKMPPLDQIDMKRTDLTMRLAHKAYMRDGRIVQWPK